MRFFTNEITWYDGNNVLLFAFAPWCIHITWRFRELKFYILPFFIGLYLIGYYLNQGFGFLALGLMISLFIHKWSDTGTKGISPKITYGGMLFLIFFVSFKLFDLLYLSRGPDMVDAWASKVAVIGIERWVFPFGAPLSALFSLMRLHRLLFRSVSTLLGPTVLGLDVGLMIEICMWSAFFFWLVFALFAMYRIIRSDVSKPYKTLLGGLYFGYAGAYLILQLGGVLFGKHEHHFMPVGILLMPGIIYLIKGCQTIRLRRFFWGLIFISCFYGVGSFGVRQYRKTVDGAEGRRGIIQFALDQKALNFIHRLDEALKEGNHLFYVYPYEIALEIETNRVGILKRSRALKQTQWKAKYGRVDNLFVILKRKSWENEKEIAAMLRSFKDYEYGAWRSLQVGKAYVFYHSSNRNSKIVDSLVQNMV